MKRKCPVCKDTFRGRSDKKFCSVECRASFHRRQHREELHYMRQVELILRNNRRILHQLLLSNQKTISPQQLSRLGYRMGYYTHRDTTSTGTDYSFCYEYALLPLAADRYLILKKILPIF